MASKQHTTPREGTVNHIFHSIQQALLAIVIGTVAGVLFGFLAAEIVAVALTQAVPGWPTHVIAVVAGLLLGYAVAATVAIWQLVAGLAETISSIGSDLDRGWERVIGELETLAGVAGQHPGSTSTRASTTVEGSVVRSDQPAMMMAMVNDTTAIPSVPIATPPVAPSVPLTSATTARSSTRTAAAMGPAANGGNDGNRPARLAGLTAPLLPIDRK